MAVDIIARGLAGRADSKAITAYEYAKRAGYTGTEEEFAESLAFAKEIGFAKSHIFAYSRREGTVAYGLPNQVSNAEKSARSKQMIEATLQTEYAFLDKLIGTSHEVLFEQEQDGFFEGYTKNYCRVKVKSEGITTGEILTVKITDRENDALIAEI